MAALVPKLLLLSATDLVSSSMNSGHRRLGDQLRHHGCRQIIGRDATYHRFGLAAAEPGEW